MKDRDSFYQIDSQQFIHLCSKLTLIIDEKRIEMFNKKILLSLLVVGTIAVVAGAGTWAEFTDLGSSTANTFTAGTLDLKLGDNLLDNIVGFNVNPVAPGSQGTAGTIKVKNNGNINGVLTCSAVNIVNSENGQNSPESAVDNTAGDTQGELGNDVTLTITDGTNTWTGVPSALSSANLGALNANSERTFTVTYVVASSAGNEIQSDGLTFDLAFTLTQAP